MPRIKSVEIQGFRVYGKESQKIDFQSDLAVIWGANSHGKTSFAEAIEFLFTGTIVRKELMASAQDEFADSLRNAHLPDTIQVYVAAEIIDAKCVQHTIRRVLANDYGKKSSCSSTLEIDGKPASDTDLLQIGIKLSQPPMAVPILMQHTLGYLFSAKPAERSVYFKALLEVSDLDNVRNSIALHEAALRFDDTNEITKLRRAAEIDLQAIANLLPPLLKQAITEPKTTSIINRAIEALLTSCGEALDDDAKVNVASLERVLARRQAKTFSISQFNHETFRSIQFDPRRLLDNLDLYSQQAQTVDEQTRQMSRLLEEVLKVPALEGLDHDVDCPVCGTEDGLTPQRIQFIRKKLENSHNFIAAQQSVAESLQLLERLLTAATESISAALPRFRTLSSRQRKEIAFTTGRMRELIAPDEHHLVETWKKSLIDVLRKVILLTKEIRAAKTVLKTEIRKLSSIESISSIKEVFETIKNRQEDVSSSQGVYAAAEGKLVDALRTIIDARSATRGWQELIDIANNTQTLHADLINLHASAAVRAEFSKALSEIDRAKEEVLNEKFVEMSESIKSWWERLRPDEPVFFSGVIPRPQTIRTIDFKAGLAIGDDRLNAHIRDVVAIFSMSQMHCLGLAAFLARSVREKCGFVILDDPILSSDEDHRTSFVHDALNQLLDLGFQVILITQDQQVKKEVAHLYNHRNLDQYEVALSDREKGTELVRSDDSVAAMLSRTQPFLGNEVLSMRKEACKRLRDIAERVCKEIIVNNLHQQGHTTASITDYSGAKGTLESLLQEASKYLNDPSHPGKLKVIGQTLNPGSHDDAVPSKQALRQAAGDLSNFRKHYSLT